MSRPLFFVIGVAACINQRGKQSVNYTNYRNRSFFSFTLWRELLIADKNNGHRSMDGERGGGGQVSKNHIINPRSHGNNVRVAVLTGFWPKLGGEKVAPGLCCPGAIVAEDGWMTVSAVSLVLVKYFAKRP